MHTRRHGLVESVPGHTILRHPGGAIPDVDSVSEERGVLAGTLSPILVRYLADLFESRVKLNVGPVRHLFKPGANGIEGGGVDQDVDPNTLIALAQLRHRRWIGDIEIDPGEGEAQFTGLTSIDRAHQRTTELSSRADDADA